MVTEMVVKESLSSEMISAGEELTNRLDKAHFIVSASFWFYISDANVWRFIIASPEVTTKGPKKVYKQIQSVIAKMPESQPKIALKDITVVDSKDPLVTLLRTSVRVTGIPGVRFSQNVVNGFLIEDAYIYRLT
jgi:hypothetical protein